MFHTLDEISWSRGRNRLNKTLWCYEIRAVITETKQLRSQLIRFDQSVADLTQLIINLTIKGSLSTKLHKILIVWLWSVPVTVSLAGEEHHQIYYDTEKMPNSQGYPSSLPVRPFQSKIWAKAGFKYKVFGNWASTLQSKGSIHPCVNLTSFYRLTELETTFPLYLFQICKNVKKKTVPEEFEVSYHYEPFCINATHTITQTSLNIFTQ